MRPVVTDKRADLAVETAKKADEERLNAEEGQGGSMFCIDVPAQQLWLFTKKAAYRSVEALKILGIKGSLSTKGLKQ